MMRVTAFVLAMSLSTTCSAQAGPQKAADIYLKTVLTFRQVDTSTYTEIDIRAPAKVVWGYLTDERMAKYSPGKYHLETGAWGEVGSVYSIHSTVGGQERPFPKMRQKVIDSIPYKYFVLNSSVQVSEDAVEKLHGYDVLLLQESNGVTKLIFIQPLSFGDLNLSKDELLAFKEGQRTFIRPIFEELKRVVESEYRP